MKTNRYGEPLRISDCKCEVKHYENCCKCFGFGMHLLEDTQIPTTAEEARFARMGMASNSYCPCEECGSTIVGLTLLGD